MNKLMLIVLLLCLSLTACGSTSASDWEDEEVTVPSTRILPDNVKAAWTLLEDASAGSKGTLIRLKITKDDGKPVDAFDRNHEKLLHLIVVSKDLSYFNHIHPEYKGNGVFEIVNDFPVGGDYRLIADFKPTGGDAMSKLEWVRLRGEPAKLAPVIPAEQLDTTADGKRVKLSISELAANKEVKLTFTISDEKTGQPITDLEPYLGSIGHVVVLSEDGERYIHVHADEGQAPGPNAVFETEFPKRGVYKIWGQFQKDNRVFTVSYVVNVTQ